MNRPHRPHRNHWTWGESRLVRHSLGRLSVTLVYLQPLCGRWMTDEGQFADDPSSVTCDHCRRRLDRLGIHTAADL